MNWRKYSKELRIGALTLVTLIVFIWGINYLKGIDIFNKQRIFYAVYGNVAGLVTANSVTVNGLKVGSVGPIEMSPTDPSRIVVSIIVNKKVNIPKNSVARLYSSDLLGTKTIQIVLGNSGELLMSGDTIQAETQTNLTEELNDMVQPVIVKTERLITTVDSVMSIVTQIFNDDVKRNLQSTAANLDHTMATLSSATKHADDLVSSQQNRIIQILSNLESITQNLKSNNDEITLALTNVSRLSDTLARANIGRTFTKLSDVTDNLAGITNEIENGDGSLAKLVNDDRLYRDLQLSAASLNKLIEDIKKNPKRYLSFSVINWNRNTGKSSDTPTDTIQ